MASSFSDFGTRNRSNSGEESGLPGHERKRPRLSEGTSDGSKSLSEISHSHPVSTVPISQEQARLSNPKPALPPRSSHNMTSPSPTSKVTINTRPLSQQSSSHNINNSIGENVENSSTPTIQVEPSQAVPDNYSPVVTSTAQVESISISSSPTRSPVIDIADPVEFDEDPADVRWTHRMGVGNSSTVKLLPPRPSPESFPLSSQTRTEDPCKAIDKVIAYFSNYNYDDKLVFQELKEWLIQVAEQYPNFSDDFISRNTTFWTRLPEVLIALLQRQHTFSAEVSNEAVVEFCISFVKTTTLIIQYDIAQLRRYSVEDSTTKPSPRLSRDYLVVCVTLLNPSLPFYGTLQKEFGNDSHLIHETYADQISSSSGIDIFGSFTNLIIVYREALTKQPKLYKEFGSLLDVTDLVAKLFLRSRLPTSQGINLTGSYVDDIKTNFEFLLTYLDEMLEEAIKKQLAWLIPESADVLLGKLNLVMGAFAVEIPQLGQKLIESSGVEFEDSDLTNMADTMLEAWRFTNFHRCMKHGRMPLRVYGADTMSQKLVQVYLDRIQSRRYGKDDPLVNFLVRFLRDNQILGYIVSKDSHPQIVNRSTNIVGFLMVAGTYQDEDTDTIWQAILNATETRTIAETLPLLSGCFQTYLLPQFYHICRKLLELPSEKVEDHLLRFAFDVLRNVQTKFRPYPFYNEGLPDAVARQLCVRLIRLYNTPAKCVLEDAEFIRSETLSQLTSFSQTRAFNQQLSLDEEELSGLLTEIRSDLEEHRETASGSIIIVDAMLQLSHLDGDTLNSILDQCDLPGSLVNDVAALAEWSTPTSSMNASSILMQFKSRIDCLCTLLALASDRFTPDLIGTIWRTLLVMSRLEPQIREYSWNCLTRVMKDVSPPNHAIDMILGDFWQQIRPIDITASVLNFAQQSVEYQCQISGTDNDPEDDIAVIPGLERVWNIMLDSPAGTVEMQATDFVIKQYLQNPAIRKRTRSSINATHLHLIDKCVQIVLGSAAKLKSFTDDVAQDEENKTMVIIASQDEIHVAELRFDRALLFLRRFIEAIKGNPGCSPITSHHFDALPEFENLKGDRKQLNFQIVGNKYVPNGGRKAFVGTLNTGTELHEYCANISGLSHVEIINGGKRHQLQDQDATLEELGITGGTIMIKKASPAESTNLQRGVRVSTPVDEKIMLHFDDLYGLLESDNRLAKEVFDFLSVSTVREKISQNMREMSTPFAELLPSTRPYKLLFCCQALRSCVEVESFSSTPDGSFLTYAVRAVTTALDNLTSAGIEDFLQLQLALQLVEVLHLAFRAKVPAEISKSYLLHPQQLVTQILQTTLLVQNRSRSETSQIVAEVAVKSCFEVLVEAALYSEGAMGSLQSNRGLDEMLYRILLGDENRKVRQAALDVMLTLTGTLILKSPSKNVDTRSPRSRHDLARIDRLLACLWKSLTALFHQATEQSVQCQQYFEALLAVLKKLGATFNEDTLQPLFTIWVKALRQHDHRQIVGQTLQEHFLGGVVKCILECARLLRARDALPSQIQLMRLIVNNFLFPPLSEARDSTDTLDLPVLDIIVRESLYDLLLMLCQTAQDLEDLVTEFSSDLIPHDLFEPGISHERQSLRSEVGYAGLRNLSNTCYLNSLFSQLFMNVQFRNLFLTARPNPTSQPLLNELAKVFAYMQNSFQKYIDPAGAVESIMTYDGDQIDVTVQMDVDEFFNLLFDRLEAQITDLDMKSKFKSLYGGETIQQIKSKECEHVSERPEPFAVLPVEIKNKSRLEESLTSYVEGEVLQGDNKYSCTSCGRHVDAVKRSCLKDVPDNLIFNLKRFDYDILTGLRTKLNDQFQFPDSLDIAPYTLKHLSNPEEEMEPDIFELTGIIVHSGTAETGHYYSYIRQRPSSQGTAHSWIQFNDQEVTTFDPNTIHDNCFGGFDATWSTLPKFYNAYMLLYQRKSSIQSIEEHFQQQNQFGPVTLQTSRSLERHIAKHNELYLRGYCAQDLSHTQFVRKLLERVSDISNDGCSNDHQLESQALTMALQFMHQVSSRCKERFELDTMTKLVQTSCQRCPLCSIAALEWFVQENVIHDSFLRSPYQATRKVFSSILLTILQTLHDLRAANDPIVLNSDYMSSMKACIESLASGWEVIMRNNRIWTEYFFLIMAITKVGAEECRLLLDADLLIMCMELISVHYWDRNRYRIDQGLRNRYSIYLGLRDRNRVFNHQALVECFTTLFLMVDPLLLSEDGSRPYDATNDKFGLTSRERLLLGVDGMHTDFDWLGRIIAGHHSSLATTLLVEELAKTRAFANAVKQCIIESMNTRNTALSANFGEAAVAFCRSCCNGGFCLDMVEELLAQISVIELEYGHEFLILVKSLLGARNETIPEPEGFLRQYLIKEIAHWAPVFLIAMNESHHNVRQDAVVLVRKLVFDPLEAAHAEGDTAIYQEFRLLVVELVHRALQTTKRRFVKEENAVTRGHFVELTHVVDECCNVLEADGEPHTVNVAQVQNEMEVLRQRSDQAVEILSPEWQESSDFEGLSEMEYT